MNGSFTVTPAPLTITADDQTKAYGAELPLLTVSYMGFVNGDTPASLSTQVVLTTPATANSPAAIYPINVGYATSNDYHIILISGSLTVIPNLAPAAITTTLDVATSPQGITLTAMVVETSTGESPDSGTISFYDGKTLIGSVPVAGGISTLHLGVMSPGSHSFSAVYVGDGTVSASRTTVTVLPDSPEVVGLSRFGFHAFPTELALTFSGPLDPISAQDLNNYQIVDSLGRRVSIACAVYDPATQTVMLSPSARLNIHRTYALTIYGGAERRHSAPSVSHSTAPELTRPGVTSERRSHGER